MSHIDIDPKELIVAVKSRKLLYDRNDERYGNRTYTNSAWIEIAEEIGTDELSARRKWSALRDYFTRQHRVVQAGAASSKKVRWCFYKNLLFLRDHLDHKPSSSSSSVKFNYDPACAEDTESASIVSAGNVKSQISSDEEEDPVLFDALEEEQPSSSKSQSRVSRSHRKRKYAEAHAREYKSSNINGDDLLGHSTHYDDDNNGGSDGIQHISNSYQDSPSHVEEDHDELFLKSLLPDLKCVTDEICKMECKIEIQGVILKFIRQSRNIRSGRANNQSQCDSDERE